MKYEKLQLRTLEIFDQAEGDDILSKLCDYFILGLVFLNIVAILLESVSSLYVDYSIYFKIFEAISVLLFTCEYGLRIWASGARCKSTEPQFLKGRLRYICSFHGIVDIIAILPFYLQVLFPGLDLRVLRTLRLLRVFKLSHYSTALEDLFSAIYQERRSFVAASYLLLLAIILTSSFMYYAENSHQPEKFSSIPNAMYWSLITLTTVGYGDVSPVTSMGKFISIFTAFLGVSIVAMLTGIVASAFTNQVARKKVILEDQIREAMKDGILDGNERRVLEKMRLEFGLSEAQTQQMFRQVERDNR
jgi:voltage-gated potassium channel